MDETEAAETSEDKSRIRHYADILNPRGVSILSKKPALAGGDSKQLTGKLLSTTVVIASRPMKAVKTRA